MTRAIVDEDRQILASELAFGRVFRRNDPTAPKDFSRSFEDQRTKAGLLRADMHRDMEFTGGRWFTVSVEDGERAAFTIVRLIMALDVEERRGNAGYFRAKIEFDRDHDRLRHFQGRQAGPLPRRRQGSGGTRSALISRRIDPPLAPPRRGTCLKRPNAGPLPGRGWGWVI